MPASMSLPFNYRRSLLGAPELHCDSVPLAKLAARYGTPLYVYSAAAIRDRWRVFDAAFSSLPHTVCYSVKANSNLSILKLLAKLGCGFDVVSGGELQRVLVADKKAARCVVFSGVGKAVDEIDLGLRSGILMFNVESEAEMWTIAERARKLRLRARVGLRVNPDVPAETHPHITTGLREHKFGVPMDAALPLLRRAAQNEWLDVCAASVHIGSQIQDVVPFGIAMQRLSELIEELRRYDIGIKYVNAGGGLGIEYRHDVDTKAPDFRTVCAKYAAAVMRGLRGLGVHLLLEPGRAIVAPAGTLLTRVLYEKTNGEKRFVIIDAGYNDLIRPTLYNAHHDIVPVVRKRGAKSFVADVVGPVCESGDFLARDRRIAAAEGELLAVLDTGAYGMSIASNYNSRLKPAELLVDGSRVRVIRRRDTFEDLVRNER